MSTGVTTVQDYLEGLSDDRREAVEAVRQVILENLPEGFEEGIQYGMISYFVPLERYPDTYNRQPLAFAGIASQKNYISVYLHGLYSDPEAADWFVEEYKKTGKKLDMGKSCVRFRKLDDLPLDLIGEAVASDSVDDFIARYEASRR